MQENFKVEITGRFPKWTKGGGAWQKKVLGLIFRRVLEIGFFVLQACSRKKEVFSCRARQFLGAMATFARPVASSIGGIDFGVYSNEDVKAISVKRIHNTPTLDTFNNPVPGGLYDPALGAWGDHV